MNDVQSSNAPGAGKSKMAELKVTLRPREAVMNSRKAEIVRAMRDAAEAKQLIELTWVEELAELVGVDIRRR